MDKKKLDSIKQILHEYLDDCEVEVENIHATGYRDYEYDAYPLIDVDEIYEEIKKILE